MRRILREPLFRFLIIALAIFGLHRLSTIGQVEQDSSTIVVDRAALLNFIQFRRRSFDTDVAARVLDGLDAETRDRLIQEYVREEALSLEARALGLNQDDYVIKRRLVQNIEYVARGFSSAQESVSEADARQYFEENRNDFRTQPRISFVHVFFASDGRGEAQALAMAHARLKDLNAPEVSEADAAKLGDRFLFGRTFSERAHQEIEGQFGPEMTARLFALTPDGTWTGPFQSKYGAHLILAKMVETGRELSFDEARDLAFRRAQDALLDERMVEATNQIVERYQVIIGDIGPETGK